MRSMADRWSDEHIAASLNRMGIQTGQGKTWTAHRVKVIARRQRKFEVAVKTGDHLAMSETNKDFHMAIADAGRNLYLAGFYERLLNQGRRMLHMHFELLERTHEGYLLTDEHNDMLAAIEAKDVARADELAHSQAFPQCATRPG
ncbi:MAG: FCD domain-containing protein [Polaromonas sp.]